ncbi:hypothetical protein HFO65_30705 [Rhizobium laguerreae]|uniref:phage exclusion protein Lit family protein n=1 Tax=Rhizobium laguerreae TaxID=1076926 RepID=UPI001C900061|nr:phage exclusion protein Lit family protein [Rhizobium laguerreae]MBY3073929.1 hypothetical protein [Rhizobium laguerreae]MBY3142536.1 hypothetical protein [Rhizobium laguerreae]MBY3164967.1 hypothetical protein [Rhizobium laguerreae]MBY3266236.1 hypothetical protein [Rhizobium laguerreae]MBY3341243.1 hypothetical protein [Rhizobium laguerreae]
MEDVTFAGDTLPSFSDLFIGYEARIKAIFDKIVAASSVDFPPKLEFTEEDSSMLFKCKPSEASVTADWHGIASLWAMSQGVGRLCAAMFNARRSGQARLDFVEGSEAELGYHFIDEARALVKPRGHRWNTYFPKPDPGSDRLIAGDVFFFRALEWILAHEVGHIVSGHDDRAWTAQQSRDEEREADRFATCYVIGGLAADPRRQPGERPSQDEIELERRAIAAGLGLVWVAIYEDTRTQDTDMYPAVAARIDDAMTGFGLADDSAALEILSDFIKAWIDPEGQWPVAPPSDATARSAMDEACARLYDHAREARQ